MNLATRRYIVAVDGGGSSCRACIADLCGKVLGRANGQAANINSAFAKSRENILAAVRRAYRAAHLPSDRSTSDYAYLGLAGASIGDAAQKLEDTLDFYRVKVATDRKTSVHGALGDADGTVALIGTGSFFTRRKQGEYRDIGGWGFRLGDDGSGAFLGHALLRRTIRAHDGLIEHSRLTRAILERFGGRAAGLVAFAQCASPKAFGKFAPELVAAFENDDPVAKSLIGGAVARLQNTLEVLDARSCGALYLLGGLGPFYQSQLDEDFRSLCKDPIGDALAGGVLLAQTELIGAGA